MSSRPQWAVWLLVTLTAGTLATLPLAAKEPGGEPARSEASPAETSRGAPDHDRKSGEKPGAAETGAATKALPAPATTSHKIALAGRELEFKAIAGAIRLSDAHTGTPEADVAYVAFLRDGSDAARRPVTFAINGGPGASSAWLDLGALGPWRLAVEKTTLSPSAPPVTIDNTDTWLDFTDLVFIDPPGTGYSRLLSKGDEGRRRFYSLTGDIDALSVVIRKWLAEHGRLASPKFIIGESYGGFRAPKLARRLEDVEGIGVHGLILVSPVLDFGWFEGTNNPLPYVTRLPSQTAVARGRAAENRSSLADVEAYAAGPYLVDLLRGERDPAALARVAEKVAGFTKLDPALVRKLGGRIDSATFSRERTRADGTVSSLYDARINGFDPAPHAAVSDAPDPVLDAVKPVLASAMADLTANRLGWPVEARYEILDADVNHAWDWGGGRSHAEALGDLKHILALDRNLRVLIVHGLTDMVTPYFASKLLIDQVPPLGDPDRLRLEVYPGGHMLYFEEASRSALREDARRLVEGK